MSESDAPAERRSGGAMKWEDWAVYALALAGIYLLVGILFFYGGKEKIIDGHGAPAGIEKQFSGTFLETIPGVDAAWTILGILECLIFVLIVISLVRLEFMPNRRKPWLLTSLGLTIFTFAILAMGQNVTGEHEGVAELYIYAGATAALLFVVLALPPYSRANWISGRGGG